TTGPGGSPRGPLEPPKGRPADIGAAMEAFGRALGSTSVQRQDSVGRGFFPVASGRPLEPRDARPKILLDPPVEGEQLTGGLLSGLHLAGRTHVILATFGPAAFPFVVPEVEVLVPVDPTHPQTAADPHFDPSFLPLFRGKSQVPMNLPMGCANRSSRPPLSEVIISAAPLYSATR